MHAITLGARSFVKQLGATMGVVVTFMLAPPSRSKIVFSSRSLV